MKGMPHLTDCGLPGVKEIPYGVHMCHFYESRPGLAATLVPYFKAGLRHRERVLWVSSDAAQVDLKKAGLDAAAALRDGALVVRDFADWYAEAETLNGRAVVDLWHEEEHRALAQGFSGLRIAGDVNHVSPEDWALFMEFEATLHQAMQGRRIVALCAYPLERYGPAEVLDVVRRHHCTLDHPDQGWQLLPPR